MVVEILTDFIKENTQCVTLCQSNKFVRICTTIPNS